MHIYKPNGQPQIPRFYVKIYKSSLFISNMETLTSQQIMTQYDGGRRDFSNVNAKGMEIISKDLSGIIFRKADLSPGSLKDCTLNKADFTGANMKWMDLDSWFNEKRKKERYVHVN